MFLKFSEDNLLIAQRWSTIVYLIFIYYKISVGKGLKIIKKLRWKIYFPFECFIR